MHLSLSRTWMITSLSFGALASFVRTGAENRLVSRARNADREAFDRIIGESASSLKRFISRRVRTCDRDDIYQDTVVAAWEALPKFDGGCRFRTWIFAICFHKIQDYWRREQTRPPSESFVDADGATAYLPAAFTNIDLREALREVWEAYTPDQRELLRLYYSDQLTLNEISLVLGRNLNTVKYQFYRAHEVAARLLPMEDREILLAPGATV